MDLADLPPVWPLVDGCVDIGRYARTVPAGSARRTVYIEAGRGCPFTCTFCATAPFWERKYRVKPVATLLEEIRFLHEQYGYNGFMLVHDLLTVDKDFLNEFSETVRESRLPVEWMANHRTDINLHGLLPKMKAAGCWAMFFGIESASERLQKKVRKGLKREGIVSTITGLADLGIGSTCSFVIGFPDETPEELSATVALGAELKLLGAGMVQFHRLRTWPPAPLSRAMLPAKFDPDSLRLEYPFLDVPDADVAAITADPEFFAGYFAPYTTAGTFRTEDVAQVELFFTHAVHTWLPLTIAVMGRLAGDSLIPTFYDVLSRIGGISRQEMEADPTSPWPAWCALRPRLEDWAAIHPALEDWQRKLVRGAMEYEESRLRFVNSNGVERDGMAAGVESGLGRVRLHGGHCRAVRTLAHRRRTVAGCRERLGRRIRAAGWRHLRRLYDRRGTSAGSQPTSVPDGGELNDKGGDDGPQGKFPVGGARAGVARDSGFRDGHLHGAVQRPHDVHRPRSGWTFRLFPLWHQGLRGSWWPEGIAVPAVDSGADQEAEPPGPGTLRSRTSSDVSPYSGGVGTPSMPSIR